MSITKIHESIQDGQFAANTIVKSIEENFENLNETAKVVFLDEIKIRIRFLEKQYYEKNNNDTE